MTAWSKSLSIGGAVDGARADGIRAIAVRPTATNKQQLGAYLDLLHWLLQEPQHGTHGHLHLPVANDELRDALGSLEQARKGKVTVAVTVGHTVPDFLAPSFANDGGKWSAALDARETAVLPQIVSEITTRVNDARFVPYQNLSSAQWFGKVAGRRICEFREDGSGGVVRVGSGSPSALQQTKGVYEAFFGAVGAYQLTFSLADASSLDAAAPAISNLIAAAYQPGSSALVPFPEAKLETDVLAGAIAIVVAGVDKLEVAMRWGQFPTRWSPGGSVKELDVLMRQGSTPWAIELKHHSGGVGTYYRHAVAQAAVYRAYIRGAEPLYPWFEKRDMDATACQAAVVVTKGPGKDWDSRLHQLTTLAQLFDVRVVVVA